MDGTPSSTLPLFSFIYIKTTFIVPFHLLSFGAKRPLNTDNFVRLVVCVRIKNTIRIHIQEMINYEEFKMNILTFTYLNTHMKRFTYVCRLYV